MSETTFPIAISEKQFFRQYERAKQTVDAGISEYFILYDNDAFANVSTVGNTKLTDLMDCFGAAYPYFFRFAGYFDCVDATDERMNYQTFKVRPMLKSDRRKLQRGFKFFPPNTWICEWTDALGTQLLCPIHQKESGEICFLQNDRRYLQKGMRPTKQENVTTAPEAHLPRMIELMPDYYDALFAIVRYKHVDIAIPIEKDSAKATFKNRERDADGVKRHLIHNVKGHERATLVNANEVKSHLRGRSNFTIGGIDVTLMASWEWSEREKSYMKGCSNE